LKIKYGKRIEEEMTEEYQILTFMILFFILMIVIHHVFIQPIMFKQVHEKRQAQAWREYESKQDVAVKSTQSALNPNLDLGNTLPSDRDIQIEDSFSESDNPISKTEYENLVESQVPTLNTQQCWMSKEFECPPKNGSYLQCTNNYIPKPDQKNCDCSNRTFEMCPFPYKISENEYYKKIGFNRQKEFGF
jgi:hypothetical protein